MEHMDVVGRRAEVTYAAAFVAVVASQLALVWAFPQPPLLDWPSHLARTYILHHLGEVELFGETFAPAWSLLPNLAMDVVLAALQACAVPITIAGQLFLSLTLVVGHVGCHAAGKAIHGRATWLALPAAAFVFNMGFLFGLVNSSLGLGTFLCALAFWIPRREDPTPRVLVVSTVLALVCAFTHLSSVVALGLAVVVLAAADLGAGRVRRRAAWLAGIPFVAPAVLLVFAPRGHGPLSWGSPLAKLQGAAWLFRTYDEPSDYAFAGALMVCAVVLLAPRGSRLRPIWPIVAVAVMFLVAYLLLPMVAAGTWAGDRRFIFPAAILAVLACRVTASRRVVGVVMAAVVVLLLLRSAHMARAWSALEPSIAARLGLLERLPPGSRVRSFKTRATINSAEGRAIGHTVHYATILRHAVVESVFANPAQHPMRRREPSTFVPDALWATRAGPEDRALIRSRCAELHEADGAVLGIRCR